MKVNSAWEAGDYEQARDSSKKAKTWIMVAIIFQVSVVVTAIPIFAIAATIVILSVV